MKYYSYDVFNPGEELELPEYWQLLEPGKNAFNITLADKDKFDALLTMQGVRIVRSYCHDEEYEHEDGRVDAQVLEKGQEPSLALAPFQDEASSDGGDSSGDPPQSEGN